MNRVQDLFDLITSYERQIQPKENHVILATHVGVVTRGFVLKDQLEQNKFNQYSGGNFNIQYSQDDDKLLVKHIFLNNTYVIEFCLNEERPWKKQFEMKEILNEKMNLIDPRDIIDRIRKTILDILRSRREKTNTVSNQVLTAPFEPLHVDIAVDETNLSQSPTTLVTPNIFEEKK